jgi:hypothetical protein
MVGRIARAYESGSDCVHGNTIYKYRFACVTILLPNGRHQTLAHRVWIRVVLMAS